MDWLRALLETSPMTALFPAGASRA
jgi:hypothetical protein